MKSTTDCKSCHKTMFVSDMQPQPQRTLQFRREHHFEYTLEQNGFPAYLRPVCIEMYNKCTAVCKTLGRTNSLHIAYLIARFRQLLLEDLVIPDKGVGQYMGVRSLPVRIEHLRFATSMVGNASLRIRRLKTMQRVSYNAAGEGASARVRMQCSRRR